jgi:hypothetical protein
MTTKDFFFMEVGLLSFLTVKVFKNPNGEEHGCFIAVINYTLYCPTTKIFKDKTV